MADFINTVDAIGDEALVDSIINRTIVEFKDNSITEIGSHTFTSCKQLTVVDCPEVTKIADNNWFDGCIALFKVNLPKLEKIPFISPGRQFAGCPSLKSLVFPEVTELNSYNVFADCPQLVYIDFWKLSSHVSQFTYPSSLKALILRNTAKVCSLGNFSTSGVNGKTFYIYVPKTMDDGTDGIAAYEAATNWSACAGRFRYIEDYTVDGTLTGEIDETKISA